jgi:hypothetical protein
MAQRPTGEVGLRTEGTRQAKQGCLASFTRPVTSLGILFRFIFCGKKLFPLEEMRRARGVDPRGIFCLYTVRNTHK